MNVLMCEFERFACACVSREKWERERTDTTHTQILRDVDIIL